MTSATLAQRDRAAVWHPFTQAATAPEPLAVVAARGAYLELADGRRVLDGISSWWTNLHGHGHPRIAQAVARQVETLDHVIFAGCTHPPAVELAERLLLRLPDFGPERLTRVFYSDDGSTAVEVALKIAFQYQAQRGKPDKRGFVAFQHGYHGDTVGAMALGDPEEYASPFAPLLFPVARVPTDDLRPLRDLLLKDADRIAAVVLEPMVQGAGGMRFQTREFVRGVADLCRAHDVLFVADEVMTGFGRTGKLFACEHAGVTPDLMCLAKGLTGGTLPLAATVATEKIYEAFLGPSAHTAFLHGHSFTANPVACAAGLASLDIFEQEGVLDRIAALEQTHAAELTALSSHPQVASVRWLGSIGVLELREEASGYFAVERGRKLARALLNRGILLRPLGPVVYALPPYATTPDELTRLWRTVGELLDDGPTRTAQGPQQ
ncbi:MAG: adenosylmethionine--8-amino-7-oxononanoate transaminase [Myxococcota bacterium]